jgi:hypothetical protein
VAVCNNIYECVFPDRSNYLIWFAMAAEQTSSRFSIQCRL